MAVLCSRTNIVLVLLLTNFIIKINCDGDITNNVDKADLLRGSEEKYEEVDEETTTRNNEEVEETTKEYTTEGTSTVELPEALGLKINTNDSDEELNEDEERAAEDDATTVTVSETETTDAMSMDVYREDTASSVSNNIETGETSSAATTKSMEEIEGLTPNMVDHSEEPEHTGQRSPKTDHTEQKSERRAYETKTISPAATKSSTLKRWLEDSWLRPPAGILVPLRPMALNRALAVWNDLTVEGLNITDIVVVGYDSNGVNWRSRHNLQPSSTGSGDRAVSEALSKLLLKYQGVNTDTTTDGTMRALASAAKLVPYDSALFVITDKGAGDAQRLPLALRALVEKRLKVYTIWTDPNHPSEESEQQLQELRNISQHTEGEVLPYSLQVMDMEGAGNLATDQQWESMDGQPPRQGRVNSHLDEDKLDTLLVRRGGGEAISLGVPVENGVSALRIYIEGLVEHAVLYPPNDAPQVDLYNTTSVKAFSPASRTDRATPRDVYLVFPGEDPDMDALSVLPMHPATPDAPAPTVGLWHLSVRCDTCDYRLYVTARTHIHFYATIGDAKDQLKLRVVGPVASVRETVLIDEYGTELAKIPFSSQPMVGDGQDVHPETPPAELTADVTLPTVKGNKIYAKIVGRDIRGEPFVRLSGPLQQGRMGRSAAIVFPDTVNDLERAEADNARVYNQKLQYNDSNVLPYNRAVSQVVNQRGSILTAVQIGLSTRLYGTPGDSLQLHFEVTNFREQAVSFRFGAVGELRFLTGISPTSQTIPSGQTVNVIVSALINANAQPGARDLVTFTAYGLEQVCISAYIYVINSGDQNNDVWPPDVRHNFQGSCIGRLGSDCAQHIWSATIIARDAVGGLLRLSSSPIGVTYDSNFISGSREEVVAVYRATCCAPRVMITAVDAFGNANSYVIDISNYLTSSAIAAIVLGVFLLIAIIAIIVFLIYWCVRRRKESRELPYTTSSRS